jgi:predicted dehydrogenase
MWLGPAPKRPFNRNRFHFNFRWFWDYAGGLLTDWGAHQVDIANFGMGNEVPASAASFGGKLAYPDDAEETPDTQQVIWQYASHTMIWEHAVGIGRGPESREHGVAYHGENGILIVDRAGWEVHSETDNYKRPRRIYRMIGEPRHQKRSRDDMHLLHVKNFIECMKSRERPHADVEIGHNSIIASHIGNLSLRLGCRIDWDKEKEKPIGNAKAEKFMQPHYRAPWKLAV